MWSLVKGVVLGVSIGLVYWYSMFSLATLFRNELLKQVEARAMMYIECVQAIATIQKECRQ